MTDLTVQMIDFTVPMIDLTHQLFDLSLHMNCSFHSTAVPLCRAVSCVYTCLMLDLTLTMIYLTLHMNFFSTQMRRLCVDLSHVSANTCLHALLPPYPKTFQLIL